MNRALNTDLFLAAAYSPTSHRNISQPAHMFGTQMCVALRRGESSMPCSESRLFELAGCDPFRHPRVA
jgi:hypothetical protein